MPKYARDQEENDEPDDTEFDNLDADMAIEVVRGMITKLPPDQQIQFLSRLKALVSVSDPVGAAEDNLRRTVAPSPGGRWMPLRDGPSRSAGRTSPASATRRSL